MRVVFMGTPDIAATCLKKILADGFEVVGVYTQPDRPKGRGMKMVFSPMSGKRLVDSLVRENTPRIATVMNMRATVTGLFTDVLYKLIS